MKILITYLFCTKGGVETALANRLRYNDYNQCGIDLLFFQDCGGMDIFKDLGCKVYIKNEYTEIVNFININKYDIVLVIDTPRMLDILYKMEYVGKVGLEVHTTYKQSLEYLQSKRNKNIDFYIVPSDYQKQLIQSILGNDIKVYVLGNAFADFFIWEEQRKVSEQYKILLWVGRLDTHKNWRLFLHLAKDILKKDQQYVFWLVGGLYSDQQEIEAFDDLIYSLDLHCRVRWIPQIENSKMAKLYGEVRESGGAYVSTSQNESFGMTVLEAMASGCPVIANNVGALTELVGTDRGLCFDLKDIDNSSNRILSYLKSDRKKQYAINAYEYVNKYFSESAIYEKFMQVLYNVE